MRAHGCSRQVLLIGRFAIKLPQTGYRWRNFVNGLLHNMNERDRWRWTRDRRLCPVLWGDPFGFVLIMRRAETLRDGERTKAELAAQFRDELIRVEPKPCSFGWLDGRLVAVDYGDA